MSVIFPRLPEFNPLKYKINFPMWCQITNVIIIKNIIKNKKSNISNTVIDLTMAECGETQDDENNGKEMSIQSKDKVNGRWKWHGH
jgi:hypothetical protein